MSSGSLPDLGFAGACDLLLAILDLDPEASKAVRARVRQLQHLGLDQLEERYARRAYGLTELARIATAFRLMQAFMMPSLAVRYLTERWDDFVPALLAGIGREVVEELGAVAWSDEKPLVLVEGVALGRLGQKSARDARYDGPLGRIVRFSPASSAPEISEIPAGVVFDSRTFMPALVKELQARASLPDRQLAHEITRLTTY